MQCSEVQQQQHYCFLCNTTQGRPDWSVNASGLLVVLAALVESEPAAGGRGINSSSSSSAVSARVGRDVILAGSYKLKVERVC
jgi:hypothetical protein